MRAPRRIGHAYDILAAGRGYDRRRRKAARRKVAHGGVLRLQRLAFLQRMRDLEYKGRVL